MRLSIVIPVLNEVACIERRLDELAPMPGLHEVLVVDGGSVDETRARVRGHALERIGFCRLLDAPRGRARQMNAGARAARGDALLFLHADCQLPWNVAALVERALSRRDVVAGAFKTWTVSDDGTRPWLHLADIRSRYTRLPYGDQALFVRKDAFDRVGGFPDQPLMEDLELSMRLRKLGRIARVPARVQVSGRRFIAHPVRDTVLVNVMPLLYRAGVKPGFLASLYADVR